MVEILLFLFMGASLVAILAVYLIAEQAHRKIKKLQKLIDHAGWIE